MAEVLLAHLKHNQALQQKSFFLSREKDRLLQVGPGLFQQYDPLPSADSIKLLRISDSCPD
jgi:hypothetical protein